MELGLSENMSIRETLTCVTSAGRKLTYNYYQQKEHLRVGAEKEKK
jgi:hypothetical protein